MQTIVIMVSSLLQWGSSKCSILSRNTPGCLQPGWALKNTPPKPTMHNHAQPWPQCGWPVGGVAASRINPHVKAKKQLLSKWKALNETELNWTTLNSNLLGFSSFFFFFFNLTDLLQNNLQNGGCVPPGTRMGLWCSHLCAELPRRHR